VNSVSEPDHWGRLKFNFLYANFENEDCKMRRREFIAGLGGAVVWPVAARGQQQGDRVRRIGVLMTNAETDPEAKALLLAFTRGLAELGWIDGRTVRMDIRWAAGGIDRLHTAASELVELRPDVLLTNGTPALAVVQTATRSIPIVFTLVGDPVGGGFVASLARPGGNITGFIPVEPPLAGKWLELLKELAPRVRRVAFLYHPEGGHWAEPFIQYARIAAAAQAVELTVAPVHDDAEVDGALAALARSDRGLMTLSDGFTTVHREQIIALAATTCPLSTQTGHSLTTPE
jgi:putative tryptophan/tyrosine transport system substrate-binding protein